MNPPTDKTSTDKLAVIHSIMRNPKLSRTIFDGASSPVGSTKRSQSKSMISILKKSSPNHFDGAGGSGDGLNMNGSNMNLSGFTLPTQAIDSSSAFSGNTTAYQTPNQYSNVTIFPDIPSLKNTTGNSGKTVADSLSTMFGNSSKFSLNENIPTGTPKVSSINHSNISSKPAAGAPVSNGGEIGSNPFSKAFEMAQNLPPKTVVTPTDTTQTLKTDANGNQTHTVKTNILADGSTETDTSGIDQTGYGTSTGTRTNPVVQGIANTLGVSDVNMRLSDIVSSFPNGANDLASVMIQHENSQLDPSLNNPGDIKYGPLAKSMGAVDSGIASKDGGNWAKFPTLDAGTKAVAQIVTNYANNGSNFNDFVSKYTGTTLSSGTAGSQGPDVTSIPKTYEDAMNLAPTFIQANTGAELFATRVGGAMATSTLPDIEDALKKQYNLDALLAKKNELAAQNPTAVQDMTDYIKGKDTYLSQINDMIDKVKTTMMTTDISNPTTNKMYTDYMNYLVNLKGSQMKTYGDYLNRSIAQYNNDVDSVDTQYSNAVSSYNSAVSNATTLDKAKYDEVHKTLVDMYNSLADAPIKLAARQKAADELNQSGLDTTNSLTGYKNDLITEQNSYADRIINTSKNPDGSVNGSLLSNVNLPAEMQFLTLEQGKNPAGVIKLFTDGAHKKLGGYLGTTDPTTGAVSGSNPAILKDTLGYEQQIENAVKLLKPLTQQQIQPAVDDAKKALIADVEQGMNNYIIEHYDDVNAAVNQLSGIKAHWWSGKPNVTSLEQWQQDNPKVDKDVLQSIWTTTQLEKQTYQNHQGNPNFNIVDGLKAASIPNATPGGKTLYGLPANQALAWYLAAQIAEPYKYIVDNGDSFSSNDLIPTSLAQANADLSNSQVTSTKNPKAGLLNPWGI